MCGGGGGERYCELLVNFDDFLYIVHAILLFQVYVVIVVRLRS